MFNHNHHPDHHYHHGDHRLGHHQSSLSMITSHHSDQSNPCRPMSGGHRAQLPSAIPPAIQVIADGDGGDDGNENGEDDDGNGDDGDDNGEDGGPPLVVIFIAFPSSAPMRRAIARRMFGKFVNILNKTQHR